MPVTLERGELDSITSSKKGDPKDSSGDDSSAGGDNAQATQKPSARDNAQDDQLQRKKRELNRLSKSRCRKRRTNLIKNLEVEIANLSAEHNSLQKENEQLRREFELCYSASGLERSAQINRNREPLPQSRFSHNMIPMNAPLQFQTSFAVTPQWRSPQESFLASLYANETNFSFRGGDVATDGRQSNQEQNSILRSQQQQQRFC